MHPVRYRTCRYRRGATETIPPRPRRPSADGPVAGRMCVSVRLLGLSCLRVKVPAAVRPGPPGPTPPDVLATWVGRSTLHQRHGRELLCFRRAFALCCRNQSASHVCVSFDLYSSCWVSGRGRDSTDLNITGTKQHLLRAERPEGRGTHKVPTQQPFDALNNCVHSFR